ncbi:hypothetical protein FBY01_102380 [Pseudomonas sp. SJZ077]|nr:hypothetical protein FBY01_102380 [Pseudomonas sp. SJZ077]
MLANCYGGCVWEAFGSAGLPIPVLHTYTQLPPHSKRKRKGV